MTKRKDLAPLGYTINDTKTLLGDPCTTTIYALLKQGILESVQIGGRRLITAESIKRAMTPKDWVKGRLPRTHRKPGRLPAAERAAVERASD